MPKTLGAYSAVKRIPFRESLGVRHVSYRFPTCHRELTIH
jgi:hypothetical protein